MVNGGKKCQSGSETILPRNSTFPGDFTDPRVKYYQYLDYVPAFRCAYIPWYTFSKYDAGYGSSVGVGCR
ncbi:hypothetical protein GCM10025751_18560 [Haladaptatus pallidirubidus]|uniref:Uncharacterized protein n=1 Tax=Haladaptatus pallidirubidus TaxID=1008152 RepID=A0AAV3UFQ1_9EURY